MLKTNPLSPSLQRLRRVAIVLSLFQFLGFSFSQDADERQVERLLEDEAAYTVLSEDLFDRLGWSLPDGGRQVKQLADAAPYGAFDPADLEQLLPEEIGYRAQWWVHRFRYYNLEWDITALQLTPRAGLKDVPTLVIINGGSANWYEFFVDPLNNPGLGQYLAQRVPVILVTIPGNYKPGGWSEANEARHPSYLLDQDLSAAEVRVRNSVYTFSLIAEGLRTLLEKISSGPLFLVGHSTGGELQFMLKNSSLKPRLKNLSLGWGTGPPAPIKKSFDENRKARTTRVENFATRKVWEVRGRSAEGYVSGGYVGPLNPVPGEDFREVAQGWFEREQRRRPHFKQTLQDMEHQHMLEHSEKLAREIRLVLKDNPYGIEAERVIEDLFAPGLSPLAGYRKMVWVVAGLDELHWDEDLDEALELVTADHFREANPGIPIRVLVLDAPLTHYGHIERPRQVAGALLAAARWLSASSAKYSLP